LYETVAEQIVADLDQLAQLQDNSPMVTCQFRKDRGVLEITVGTRENSNPGVFHRITGAVTSQRMTILAAEINTLADGLVLDRYFVRDQDHDGEPPVERMEEICDRIRKQLTSDQYQSPTFAAVWASRQKRMVEQAIPIPTEIKIDNSTSELHTIVEIFTEDRQGLLYHISKTIFEMGLSVHVAKITTHLDQVVDVFYVTDENDARIEDPQRLNSIKETLGQALQEKVANASG